MNRKIAGLFLSVLLATGVLSSCKHQPLFPEDFSLEEETVETEEEKENEIDVTNEEETRESVEEVVEETVEETIEETEAPFVLPEALYQVPVETDSIAYCITDDEGTVYMEKNALMHLSPASTTKVLTALVAYENSNLSDMVTVSEQAVNSIDVMSSGVSPSFRPGEVVSVKDLLYALIMPSTNAAGSILAEHVAGSEEAFAELMNEKCRALGLRNSHFVNAHGLDRENHYTCAYDLSVILREACKYADLVQILRTPTYTLDATNLTGTREVRSGHGIINGTYPYDGVFAGKPGWTVTANSTLVTAVEKYGKKFYITVMNSDERLTAIDTINLAETVYENFAGVPKTLRPLIHEVTVTGEDISGIHLHVVLDGAYSSFRTVCYNKDLGPSSASFQDITPEHEMDLFFPMSNAASYMIQLFATGPDGKEVGIGKEVLFTGQMKTPGDITNAFGGNYYINPHGLLETGVIEFPGYALVTDSTGKILYNTLTPDGMFFVDENGHVISGWKELSGYTYYFQSDGIKMRNGSILIDGVWHTFDENGALIE